MMITYGIIADVSIGQLFIAGFIPGFILALMFSGYIIEKSLKKISFLQVRAKINLYNGL